MGLAERLEFVLWPAMAVYLVVYIAIIFAAGIPLYLVSVIFPSAASRLRSGFITFLLVLAAPFQLLPPIRE